MQARLVALKSAVPPFALQQTEVARRAAHLFSGRKDIERLLPIFVNTGIDTRYSCVPVDWYELSHGWKERSSLYVDNALDLLEQVTLGLLQDSGLRKDDIDAIVVASTTGIATPSLDALLTERMGLRRDIQRLPIFGLGCAGGIMGLSRAAQLAQALPGANVLFLVVELCALTFRKDDLSKSNIVATALFGDGAAGAILSTKGRGRAFGSGGEYTWRSSLDVMGWEVEEDGLKARFSQSIPDLVSREFRDVLNGFLDKQDLDLADFDSYACHPGGAKVLDALEDAFQLGRGMLTESRSVLRDYGNMSAATALFVLERMNWKSATKRTMLSALGPGFSCAFQVLDPA